LTRRAAFLDRDGVLNVRPAPHEYVCRVDDFHWLPGAPAAVARVDHDGYLPIVVSNQRGVARGLLTRDVLLEIERKIQSDLAPYDARVHDFLYCPHEPSDGCGCRKPRPGLLLEAAERHGIDLTESVMIGDSVDDIAAGRAAGCHTILVGPGAADAKRDVGAETVAPDLAAAATLLIART